MRKPEIWHSFAKALSNGFVSINRLHEMGLGVSRLTIWRWRNRFLSAQAQRQAEMLSGVVEADETYFKTSFKGSRGWVRGAPPENRPPRYRGEPAIKRGLSKEQIAVLAAVDSSGNIFEAKISGLADIRPTLKNRIEPSSIICSDGVRTYVHLAMDTSSEHRRIWTPTRKTKAQKLKGGKPRQKGRLALGRVNSHHERMETFVNRLARGASTANLATYLGWQRTVGRLDFTPKSLLRDALA
jgi:transposase-like protein